MISYTGFDLVRQRALPARRALAAGSGALALLAPGAPTGMTAYDAALRASLAAVVVLLASRSRPWVWVAAALLATVGVAGSPGVLAAALVTLGASIPLATTVRRTPLGGAVMGLALVQLALRLNWPEPQGATAALAALMLVPVVVSGLRRSPSAQRRQATRVAVAAAGLAVLGVAVAAVAGFLVRQPVRVGTAALGAALAAGQGSDQPAVQSQLAVAAAALADARGTLESGWLLPARLVPVVSQHVAALRQAARAGDEVALTGAETSRALDLGSLQIEAGSVDLESLRALRQPVAQAMAGLDRARRQLASARSPWLVGPVGDRLDRETQRLDRTLEAVTRAHDVVKVLPGLLGGDGPRRWFVAIQTPAELRGSGGIIGNFAEIVADDGRVRFSRFGRDSDLNSQGTPPEARVLKGPPDYLSRYSRFQPERVWQNVTVSPDFPSVAEVITGLYPQSGGSAVDGVISVDPFALAALLRVLGPVTVDPWPEPITGDNAERILLFEQYVRLEGTPRTEFLSRVAEAVAQRLTSGALPPPAALVRGLAPSVRGHHLMLFSSAKPEEQALFRSIGADGAVPVGGDFLSVVNQNAGGNKVDWFLRRSSDYEARVDPATGTVRATLTVTLTNQAPPAGLPDYIIGSFLRPSPDPRGANRTYLSVYSPLGLESASLDGEPVPVESELELGHHVYSLYLPIPPGGNRTLRFQLAGRLPDAGRYRMTLRRQPLANPETVSVGVTGPGGGRLATRAAAPLFGDVRLGSGEEGILDREK